MKIITLWQPWASLVALNLKHYETRSWPTNYRGPLLIHAAKRPFVKPDHSASLDHDAYRAWLTALDLAYASGLHNDQTKMPFANQLPLGAVVAIAVVDGCYRMLEGKGSTVANYEPPHYTPGDCTIHVDSRPKLERSVGDWRPDRYAWKLTDVQRLVEPIPWRGGQGLRDAPPELQALIAAAPKVYADGIPF